MKGILMSEDNKKNLEDVANELLELEKELFMPGDVKSKEKRIENILKFIEEENF